jgi:hypothetical protein
MDQGCSAGDSERGRRRGARVGSAGAGVGPRWREHACASAGVTRQGRANTGSTAESGGAAARRAGREPNLQAGVDASKHGKEAVASLGHRHQWSTPDEGRRIERKDASLLAHEMHEKRRAERKGGKAEVATGCNEFGGATHGELPSSVRKSRQEQHRAGSTHSARPAAVVDRP